MRTFVLLLLLVGVVVGCEPSKMPSGPKMQASPAGQSDPKMQAFHAVVEQWGRIPDEYASRSEREAWGQKLEELQQRFIDIPFDPTNDREQARAIIDLYQKKIEKRYSGFQYMLLEEHIQQMYHQLIK